MKMRSFFNVFSNDLAIDLGTANTLVYAKGRGIVVSEPSIVAINKITNKVEAVGKEAKEMLGRTPGNIVAIRPMKDGVIADFEVTEKMLQHFIRKAHNGKSWVSPRVVIGVPGEITQVERRAVIDAANRARASEVYLVEEAMAAAIGAGLPITEPYGNMIVDVGGGTTDIAVFYDNIIRHTAVIPFGGNILTTDIQHGLMVMARQAEQLKTRFGKAIAEEASPNEIVSIPGIRNRTAKEISVKNLSSIIQARMEEIIEMAHTEIINSGYENRLAGGIVITGGGSQLSCLKQLVEYMTGMDTRIGYPNEHLGKSKLEAVKSPMYATAVGLVLSGFRSLDEREERYKDKSNQKQPVRVKKDKTASDFFSSILSKTKGLLIDDLDGKNEY